jgi:hypothetical protein
LVLKRDIKLKKIIPIILSLCLLTSGCNSYASYQTVGKAFESQIIAKNCPIELIKNSENDNITFKLSDNSIISKLEVKITDKDEPKFSQRMYFDNPKTEVKIRSVTDPVLQCFKIKADVEAKVEYKFEKFEDSGFIAIGDIQIPYAESFHSLMVENINNFDVLVVTTVNNKQYKQFVLRPKESLNDRGFRAVDNNVEFPKLKAYKYERFVIK